MTPGNTNAGGLNGRSLSVSGYLQEAWLSAGAVIVIWQEHERVLAIVFLILFSTWRYETDEPIVCLDVRLDVSVVQIIGAARHTPRYARLVDVKASQLPPADRAIDNSVCMAKKTAPAANRKKIDAGNGSAVSSIRGVQSPRWNTVDCVREPARIHQL